MRSKQSTFKKCGLAVTVSAALIGQVMIPQVSYAKIAGAAVTLPDLFPIDTPLANNPVISTPASEKPVNQPKNNTNTNNKPNNSSSTATPTYNSSSPGKMRTANVPTEYSCPLFDNKPHAELLNAIDSLSNEIKVSQQCTGNPAVSTFVQNANALKAAVSSLQGTIQTVDSSEVNVTEVDQKVTMALQATQAIGSMLNNNSFLSSNCGRQAMSSGKALLAFNDILNGLSPYALMAVSMNAALAPALPYVVGGIVVTSGISAMGKMIDQNSLDMTNPDHRSAVLVNTCQYMKVAKKVRFMQLAQSGRIDRITAELEKNVQLYNSKFSQPSKELNQLLSLKSSIDRTLAENERELKDDQSQLNTLVKQSESSVNDDLIMCMLGTEMIDAAKDELSFPNSVYTNLSITARNTGNNPIQVASLKAVHSASQKRIKSLANLIETDESALKMCASTTKSWINAHKQAIQLTQSLINSTKSDINKRLAENNEYKVWKNQFDRLQLEKITVTRVEKAMEELAKDNSIIDRSELDQRMSLLKEGLFGRRGSMTLGRSPVQSWLEHTVERHQISVSAFLNGWNTLVTTSYNLSYSTEMRLFQDRMSKVKNPRLDYSAISNIQAEAQRKSKSLETLNLDYLPLGTRENQLVCAQLETAWLDWSAAMDHLGATEFFCDLIDPALDVKVDRSLVSFCRGSETVGGLSNQKSAIQNAKELLARKGFRNQAMLVSKKMKELSCPLPPVSVMNNQ